MDQVYFSFAGAMLRTGITLGKQFPESQGAQSCHAATTRTAQRTLPSSTSYFWKRGLLKLSLEVMQIILTRWKWPISQKLNHPELCLCNAESGPYFD